MNQDTTIGVFLDYDSTKTVTIEQLASYIRRGWTCYTPKQYCDMKYSNNLLHFNYDPYTGEKIDWKEVRKLLEEYIESWKIEK